jgi:hypothetical protein
MSEMLAPDKIAILNSRANKSEMSESRLDSLTWTLEHGLAAECDCGEHIYTTLLGQWFGTLSLQACN